MLALAIGGGLLLALAFLLREGQLHRERIARDAEAARLKETARAIDGRLRRVEEELVVLRGVLLARKVMSPEDLERGRIERRELAHKERGVSVRIITDENETIH